MLLKRRHLKVVYNTENWTPNRTEPPPPRLRPFLGETLYEPLYKGLPSNLIKNVRPFPRSLHKRLFFYAGAAVRPPSWRRRGRATATSTAGLRSTTAARRREEEEEEKGEEGEHTNVSEIVRCVCVCDTEVVHRSPLLYRVIIPSTINELKYVYKKVIHEY